MDFLTGSKIQTQVAKLVTRNGEVMAAVAYWGTDAAERTGLTQSKKPKKVRVICDLLSGACNPEEIERLIQQHGISVRTLDRLHAKVWINGDHVILGSANASRSGLTRKDDSGTNANIEAAILSKDPSLSRAMTKWFEGQWEQATEIEEDQLAIARRLWNERRRSTGRAFTSTVIQKIRNPAPSDRLDQLRLVAYIAQPVSDEASEFLRNEGWRHYSEEEMRAHGDDPRFYELPRTDPIWRPRPGTVFVDFTCDEGGGKFTFNGFWQVRDCPAVILPETRLTLLTKLPHFHGYAISRKEVGDIAGRIERHVAQKEPEPDEFGFYIDMDFLEFWDTDRPALRQRLVARVVEAARELCRSGQFTRSLTLQAIRVCKEDAAWLNDYARYVGGEMYRPGNHLKHELNLRIGQGVRVGVGATVVRDNNGRSVRDEVVDEIIQSYTRFETFDPAAVAER